MKKSYFRVAAMVAASVLSVSSFVSCDEEEENNSFKSETFTVELPLDLTMTSIGGPNYYFCWEWTNSAEAAAVELIATPSKDTSNILSDYSIPFDTLNVSTFNMSTFRVEKKTFTTKENGVRELKFNYLKCGGGIDTHGEPYYISPIVLRDTVIKF